MKLIQILDNNIRSGDLIKHRITLNAGEVRSFHSGLNTVMIDWKDSCLCPEWVQVIKKRKSAMLWNYIKSFPAWFNNHEKTKFWLTNGNKYMDRHV